VTDRLRKWMDEQFASSPPNNHERLNAIRALRAVVELAEPTRNPKHRYHPEYTLAMLHVLSAIEREVLK
jgi:hypothetical protein